MEVTGETLIDAPQTTVYAALCDPATLRKALPGAQVVAPQEDGGLALTLALKLGTLRTVTGRVRPYNEDPPHGASLRLEASTGTGGRAGIDAHVALAAVDPLTTNIAFHVAAHLSGGLESEAERLEELIRALAAEFFSRLEATLQGHPAHPLGEDAAMGGLSRRTDLPPVRASARSMVATLSVPDLWSADEERSHEPLGMKPERAAEDPDFAVPAAFEAQPRLELRAPLEASAQLEPQAAFEPQTAFEDPTAFEPQAAFEDPTAFREGGVPYQPPRYPQHPNYPDIDALDDPVVPAEVSTTDATGGPIAPVETPSQPAALAERGGTLPQTPYVSLQRPGRDAPDGANETAPRAGLGRWLLAAAGIAAIALLLNGGFPSVLR